MAIESVLGGSDSLTMNHDNTRVKQTRKVVAPRICMYPANLSNVSRNFSIPIHGDPHFYKLSMGKNKWQIGCHRVPVQAATHHLLPTAADAAGFPRPFLDFAAEVPRTHRGRRDDLCGLRALVPVAHHLAGIVESSWREMGTSNEPPQKPRQY